MISDKTFFIDSTSFDFNTAFKLMKSTGEYTIDQILENITQPYRKDEALALWESVNPITPQEILGIYNNQERMVAMSIYGMDKMLEHLVYEVIDEQVLKASTIILVDSKGNKVSGKDILSGLETNTLKEKVYEYLDTYTLLKITVPIVARQFNSFNPAPTEVSLFAVKCNCTTTGKTYFLYVPPNDYDKVRWTNIDTWEYETDVIKALCKTFRVNVKEEAVDYFIRQGDILNAVVKDKYKTSVEDWHCDWREVTKEEYLSKFTVQS